MALSAVQSGVIDVLLFSISPCYDLQPADEDVEQLWNREKYKGNLLNMDPVGRNSMKPAKGLVWVLPS